MNELLESYVNGNISYVKQQLIDNDYLFSELYDLYIAQYDPNQYQLDLFVSRLDN